MAAILFDIFVILLGVGFFLVGINSEDEHGIGSFVGPFIGVPFILCGVFLLLSNFGVIQ